MEMETIESAATETTLLHPELLSKEEIVNLLSEKCHLRVENAGTMDKGMLVSLFQRTVMPLPQRVPRANRRGRRTKALIKRLDARRPKPVEKPTEYQNPRRSAEVKKGLLISSDLNLTSGTRLKPPPVVINKKKAILKLGSSPASANNNISLIRTGVAKVSLSNKPAGDRSDAPGKSGKVDITPPGITKITLSSTKSDKPDTESSKRTKITFSNSETDNGFEMNVGSAKKDNDHNISMNNSETNLLEDHKKETGQTGVKRNYITFNDGEQKSVSSRLKVSGAAKDAVRKALLGNSVGNQKGHKSQGELRNPTRPSVQTSQSIQTRPAIQTSPENNGSSEKKRKKITWP